MGIIAAGAAWAQGPFLAPSLGSAVFTQLLHPNEKSAKPYTIVTGQVLGAAAGFAAVLMTGAAAAPPFMGTHSLEWVRVEAIAGAALLAAVGRLPTGALTPAGGATALVVALGAESTSWRGVFHLAAGLLAVTALGEMARRAILRQRQTARLRCPSNR